MARVTDNRGRRSRNRRRSRGPLLGDRAVDIARAAVEDMDEGPAGAHAGVNVTHPGVAVHSFAADLPGYRGWEWHVVLACAPGTDHITVSEVALVPGDSALRAPAWIPYEERLRPGDLGPRDLLPPAADDPRLTTADAEDRELSPEGLRLTAERWLDGDTGPHGEFADEALRHCGTCAFFVPLEGPLGADFGACVNEWAFDGDVVHVDHGCGAHSATPEVTGAGAPEGKAYDDQAIVDRADLRGH